MIAYLKGTLVEIRETAAVLEIAGIGYRVFVTARDASRLRVGETVQLHTFLHVREDAMQLFGFCDREDLGVFRLLLGVNGIGPKAALGILSVFGANDLRFAVLADDVKLLASAPGIGKKTAQKLILELRDKLSLQEAFAERANVAAAASPAQTDSGQEAVQALVALGYSASDALREVRAVDAKGMETEDLLRAALRQLSAQ